jgi:hypothetical protein
VAEEGLTERELRMLAFEKQTWSVAGAKESAIRDEFGLTPITYFALLNGLLGLPAAEAVEPELVHRLIRVRDERIKHKRVGEG